MDLSYKLVSDWNMQTGVDENLTSLSFITVDSEEVFSSNNAGNYSIMEVDGVVHGTYSVSNIFHLFYFSYTSTAPDIEAVIVGENPIVALNPQITLKDDGLPIIIYYDPVAQIVKSVEKDTGGDWEVKNIEFVSMNNPIGKREISVFNDSTISTAYVYNIAGDRRISYATYNGSFWEPTQIILTAVADDIRSVALVENSSGEPVIIIGTDIGLYCVARDSGSWSILDMSIDNDGVLDVDAVYDSDNDTVHVGYATSYEVRYNRFDFSEEKFLSSFKFIDFAASSVSIALNSENRPHISYSHVESTVPLFIYLKVAIGTDNGEEFQSFNIDSSNTGLNTGEFSDIVINDDDNMYILYLDSGIVLFDQSVNSEVNAVDATTWRDRRAVNNLVASTNPPQRSADNSAMIFDGDNEEYFRIDECYQTDLGTGGTEFSITFRIIPADNDSLQTIVSKGNSDDGGFNIYLNNLTLGFSLNTIYKNINVEVADIPAETSTRIGFVYSGYDVKVYIKRRDDADFEVHRFSVFGNVQTNNNPFIIGAKSISSEPDLSSSSSSSDSESSSSTESSSSSSSGGNSSSSSSGDSESLSSSSSSSSSSSTCPFRLEYEDFLYANVINLKFWNRELSYEEATYSEVPSNYHGELDPYGNGVDYVTLHSGYGAGYFFLNGKNLSVSDYGGISTTNLLSYSNFNFENRITNAPDLSFDPFGYKVKSGGVNIVWADRRSGNSEIYVNQLKSNNKVSPLSGEMAEIKSSGCRGQVFSGNNILVDHSAEFLEDGVYVGDFVNITSGSSYVGRKIPVINVVSNTVLELGVYFSQSEFDFGYFVDTDVSKEINDTNIKITDLGSNSTSPVGVSDNIGDSHIVWQALEGEHYQLYYKRFRPSNSLEQMWAGVKVTDFRGNSTKPSLAIDKEDIMHLVWEDERNNFAQIMYSKSASTTCGDNRVPKFVRWSSSNFDGHDTLISGNLIGIDPNVIIDKNNVAHIVFAGRETNGDVSEIYYVNNKNGYLTKPLNITNFGSFSKSPKIVEDCLGNLYVVFVSDKEGTNDIYLVKFNEEEGEWSSVKNVNISSLDSNSPTVSIDSSGIMYIFWIQEQAGIKEIKYTKYDTANDDVSFQDLVRISSVPDQTVFVNSIIDDTKTVFVSWEDTRDFFIEGDNNGSEIYQNILTNLVPLENNFEATEPVTEEEIAEQLSNVIVGQKFPDDIPVSDISPSGESLESMVITFENDFVSYSIDVGKKDNIIPDPNIIMTTRNIRIKIKGLPSTLAYRIKNNDDPNAEFSEFFPFDIDESPNTTVTDWILSKGNGLKNVCIQLYTIQGLTSMSCHDLFLNESDLFSITIPEDNGDQPGQEVSNIFNNSKVLTSKSYWVKIEPLRLVLPSEQTIHFDVVMQGNDLLNLETVFIEGAYFGKFTIQPEDNVRYVDGGAKIIPIVVDK